MFRPFFQMPQVHQIKQTINNRTNRITRKLFSRVFSCRFCPPGYCRLKPFCCDQAFRMLFITIKVWSYGPNRCLIHTMNKNFRKLVALPSITHYRSVSLYQLHCTYVLFGFHSFTLVGWSRKTKELLVRLVVDSKAGHDRQRDRKAKPNWQKHVKQRRAKTSSSR